MSAATFPPIAGRHETLGGTLLLSIFLHGFIFFIAIGYAGLGLRFGQGWGMNWRTSEAIHAKAVSSLPGVPLPSPMLATLNNVATQNPGLYKSEPEPPPPPVSKAEEIPKF